MSDEYLILDTNAIVDLFIAQGGVVAQVTPEARLSPSPLTPLTSGHANDLGCSEGADAVDEGDADLDFG